MTTEGINRKLTAILSADAVGYSRLMSEDEVGTVQRLKSYREVIGIRVREHHGRVVDSPGDNLLAEFPSALDAVRSAIEIQRVLKDRNADLPDNRRMEFRIGIHLGDVMVDGDRIYGDGVNIASRLEGLSHSGGISISGIVHELIKNKFDLEFEDIGNQDVKNIPDPVRAYRISIESRTSILTKEKTEISSSGKPSIAVLPFVNMSNDPDQEYFSDGMAEEILNGLAKNPGLIVKARTSSFAFKGQSQDIRKIGGMLNVSHIVEGSVRKSGNRIRITAQLINTKEDSHIWSDRYDRELADVFKVQDEISAEILKALNIHLLTLDEKQVRTANIEAYDYYLLGLYQFSLQQLDEAVESFEKAVSLDPNYADAYGALSLVHNQYIWWNRDPAEKRLPIVQNYIDKTLSLNSNQSNALSVRACIRFFRDRAYQKAINEITDLARKYPNDTYICVFYGWILPAMGRFDLAFMIYDKMVELDPLNPFSHATLGFNYLLIRDYDNARQSFERMELLGMKEPLFLSLAAFGKGDVKAMQKQLNYGQANWGNASHTYPMYEAMASYLKGDYKRVKEILDPLWQTDIYLPLGVKSRMALLEGDLDLALDYYTQAIIEPEYTAFRDIQAPLFYARTFPDYRSHPKYQKMLRDVGLDDESISKLKIPSLPF